MACETLTHHKAKSIVRLDLDAALGAGRNLHSLQGEQRSSGPKLQTFTLPLLNH